MDSTLTKWVNNEASNSDLINALLKLNTIKIEICSHNSYIGEGDIWDTYSNCHKKFRLELEKLEYDVKMSKEALYKLLMEKALLIDIEGRKRMNDLINNTNSLSKL